MPEVSIIMPAYNAGKYILSSIQSVIDQTFQNWELIVVDDGSTDDTAAIVKLAQLSENRIVYIYQQNKRLGAARNAGLRKAKGNWIAFLDSDDLWYSEKLAIQIAFVEKNKVDVVFTDGYALIEETQCNETYPTRSGWFTGKEMYGILYQENIIPILSVLMNREWIDKIGYQDESLEIFGCEDLDYWLRIAKGGGDFYGMTEKLFQYRVHPNAMSRNNTIMNLAMSTALYNNIDKELLQQKSVVQKFHSLCFAIIPELIRLNRIKDAIKQVEILSTFNNKINYSLLHWYLKNIQTPSIRITYFLLSPVYLLRQLKNGK